MLADPNVPTAQIPAAAVSEGMSLAEAFVQAGMVSSRGEARRLAAQGGLSVDGTRVDDVDAAFATANGATLFQVGKKRFKRVLVQ
jgi:tyrosyl-tRNA synthetase